MLELPASTAYGRRIPKQKFYDNLPVTPEIRRQFIDQIASIHWRNKIAPSTANIAPGEAVAELEVFEIRLHSPRLHPDVLRLIDREIPYHILFLLAHEGKEQAWIGYKETAQSGGAAFRVSAYYHTEWLPAGAQALRMEGTTTDAVYESFVRQVAGEALQSEDRAEEAVPLRQAVELSERRQKLRKQIEVLQKRVDAERQFNRRVELNEELKRLKAKSEKNCIEDVQH